MIQKRFSDGRRFGGVIIPTGSLDEAFDHPSDNSQPRNCDTKPGNGGTNQRNNPGGIHSVPVEPSLDRKAWLPPPGYRLIPVESGYDPPPANIPVWVTAYHEARPDEKDPNQGDVLLAIHGLVESEIKKGYRPTDEISRQTDIPDDQWPKEWVFPDGPGGSSSFRLEIPARSDNIADRL